ncbi:hypothetical protein SDC9_194238 [bioreactor metagenome]|uniref:Uncharacterized protein n=1 Tax=bioreactor metagenome TaxID=1076179 RepID=A0A645I5Q4_9ZZZZ
MRPWHVTHETLQKLGSGHRPSCAASNIGYIGETALEAFGIVIVQWHAPAWVKRRFARRIQSGAKGFIIGEQAAAHAAQRYHACTGQGGDVNQRSRLEARCIGQCVAQHQASLGVGVENFNGLSMQAGHHVARLERTAIGQVLTGRDQPHHVDCGLELTQGTEHAQHAGSAPHVELHLVHLSGRLE